MKILIADDDAAIRLSLRIALAQAGLDAQTAASAAVARGLLEREPFDWLITDGNMPPEDGFTLAKDARRMRPRIRTVMISGLQEWPLRGNSAVQRLFVKPVDLDALIDYLRTPRAAPS